MFSHEINREPNSKLQNVVPIILESLSRICSYCNHYGASVPCSFNNCDKMYHFPCSAASCGFQYLKTYAYICKAHVDHIPLIRKYFMYVKLDFSSIMFLFKLLLIYFVEFIAVFNEVTCRSCYSLGDVSNLMMCSVCGNHYHAVCVGLRQLPELRTGWQCTDCRTCQVCRNSNDTFKVMLCEVCNKAYHANCLRPVLTSIPKFGWKCKVCIYVYIY